MKLIDILVEELPKRGGWAEGVEHAWCDPDGEIRFRNGGCEPDFYPDSDVDTECRVPNPSFEDDSRYIITREQYEAALAAKNDGWIEWGGGECPVPDDSLVEVKYRNGTVKPAEPARFYIWTNGYGSCSTTDADIIAYRLHQPQEEEQAEEDGEADLNDCIGQAPAPLWNGEGPIPPVGRVCEWQDKNTKQWQPVKVVYASEWVTVIREINKEKGDDLVEIAIENYGDDARLKFRPIRSESDKKRDEAKFAIAELCRSSASNGHSADLIYDAIAACKIPGVKLED